MESLLKLLPMMIRLSGDNEEVREQAAFAAWRAAAGKGVANACVPFRLYRKQLVIAVLDQTWQKQLEKLAGEYIFRINSLLGAPLVTFIEFRVDRNHVMEARKGDVHPFEFHHTEELVDELQSSASHIKDPELRQQFLRAAAKSLERQETGEQ